MSKLKRSTKRLLISIGIFFGIIVLSILLYISILLFPQLIFANKFEYKNFTVYYQDSKINHEDMTFVLDKSIELLSQSELFDNQFKQNVFICSSYSEYSFLAPMHGSTFGVNVSLTRNIILANSSFPDNLSIRKGNDNNKRTLSSVIAHETVHSLLVNKLGFAKYRFLPTWKNEGYCDFIANESSYDELTGMDNICNDIAVDSPSFEYFKYRLYATYLFQEKKITLESFLNDDFDIQNLHKEIKEVYCQ